MITKQMVINAIDEGLIDGNGHSIMDAQYYLEHGFDCESLVTEFESDTSSGKTTIFKDGEVQEKLWVMLGLCSLCIIQQHNTIVCEGKTLTSL